MDNIELIADNILDYFFNKDEKRVKFSLINGGKIFLISIDGDDNDRVVVDIRLNSVKVYYIDNKGNKHEVPECSKRFQDVISKGAKEIKDSLDKSQKNFAAYHPSVSGGHMIEYRPLEDSGGTPHFSPLSSFQLDPVGSMARIGGMSTSQIAAAGAAVVPVTIANTKAVMTEAVVDTSIREGLDALDKLVPDEQPPPPPPPQPQPQPQPQPDKPSQTPQDGQQQRDSTGWPLIALLSVGVYVGYELLCRSGVLKALFDYAKEAVTKAKDIIFSPFKTIVGWFKRGKEEAKKRKMIKAFSNGSILKDKFIREFSKYH